MDQSIKTSQKSPLGQGFICLCSASFLFSFAFGLLLVSLPFVVVSVGGSDKELGLCFGLTFASYITMCLAASFVFHHFNPKRVLQIGSAGITLASAGIYITVPLSAKGLLPVGPITAIEFFIFIAGINAALFWPPIMGWLSGGHEGPRLSGRLGVFNFSWASALVVSPFIGGWLAEINPLWPIILSVGPLWPIILSVGVYFLAFCLVSVAHMPTGAGGTEERGKDEDIVPELPNPAVRGFCWMARISLLTSSAALGLLRTQLALLLTENLGFSESHFGVSVTIMSLANLAVLYAAGRIHRWHYRLGPFVGAQVLVLVGMFIVVWSAGLLGVYTAVAMVGLGQGFMYCSHQFYGVSGGRKRARRMAIHEMAISGGYAIGSIFGGYLGENLGRRSPYWFGFAIMAGALAAGGIIYLRARRRDLAKTQVNINSN